MLPDRDAALARPAGALRVLVDVQPEFPLDPPGRGEVVGAGGAPLLGEPLERDLAGAWVDVVPGLLVSRDLGEVIFGVPVLRVRAPGEEPGAENVSGWTHCLPRRPVTS